MDVDGASGGQGRGFEAIDFLGGGDGDGDVVFDGVAVFFGKKRAEQEDRPAGADFTQSGRFGEVGHGKEIRARVHQARGGLVQPVAVGVRFYNSDIAHVGGQRCTDEP